MPSPAILDGAKDEAPQVAAPIVQRRLLNQVEVGRVLQRSLMLHASRLLSDRPRSAIFKLAWVPMPWESAFGRAKERNCRGQPLCCEPLSPWSASGLGIPGRQWKTQGAALTIELP